MRIACLRHSTLLNEQPEDFHAVLCHSDGTFSVDLLCEHVNQGNPESDSRTKTTTPGEIWFETFWRQKRDIHDTLFNAKFSLTFFTRNADTFMIEGSSLLIAK